MKDLLYGRELLEAEVPEEFFGEIKTDPVVERIASSYVKSNKRYCNRCQALMTLVKAGECICGTACAYCRNCLKMGKVRACSEFYTIPEPNAFETRTAPILEWDGKLSEQQNEASEKIIESIQKNETRLLWAVAGAGKTEMLFRGIELALLQKKRVCLATPRVDVALELAPRIQAAFPSVPLSVLYGEMEEPYSYRQLVISTTHQLFRFREAFDVLIIDEVDAFPFHLDETLQYAAEKARKKKSTLIYLSATPDEKMQHAVKEEKLVSTILPARYHGHPLPVPKPQFCRNWRVKLLENPLKTTAGKEIDRLIQMKKRFILFAPNIEWMLTFGERLRTRYPEVAFETVYSADPERKEKVMRMREEKLQFLISSTILERGVTFPNIDVLVIGAEDRIFTESALVQIAGRAGRSPIYPTGNVWYFHDGQSNAMKKAIKQIRKMNRLAKKRGLIQ